VHAQWFSITCGVLAGFWLSTRSLRIRISGKKRLSVIVKVRVLPLQILDDSGRYSCASSAGSHRKFWQTPGRPGTCVNM